MGRGPDTAAVGLLGGGEGGGKLTRASASPALPASKPSAHIAPAAHHGPPPCILLHPPPCPQHCEGDQSAPPTSRTLQTRQVFNSRPLLTFSQFWRPEGQDHGAGLVSSTLLLGSSPSCPFTWSVPCSTPVSLHPTLLIRAPVRWGSHPHPQGLNYLLTSLSL